MAATVTLLGNTVDTNAGNKTFTGTPAVGDLIVVVAEATGVATSAVTDNQSGTYTKVTGPFTGFSTTGNLDIWVRTAAIPAASSTIWTVTQTSSTGGGLSVFRIASWPGAFGASAVRSSGGQSTGTSGTAPAPVLSSTPLTTNPVIVAVSNGASSPTITAPTGFTRVVSVGYTTPGAGLQVSTANSGITTATLTHGSNSSSAFASAAVELAYDSAPNAPTLNLPLDTYKEPSLTPQLVFSGTDPDSEAVTYEVQVDTVNTFDSNSSPATPAFVQAKIFRSSSAITAPAVTLASTPTAGNVLVAGIFTASTANTPTITGWNALTNYSNASGSMRMFWKVSDGTETTITGTISSSTVDMGVAEYSGVDTVSPLDTETSGVATGTAPTYVTPSITPTSSSKRVIIAMVGHTVSTVQWTSPTIGGVAADFNGVSNTGTYTSAFFGAYISSTSGSYTGQATASSGTSAGAGAIVALKGGTITSPLVDKLSASDPGFTDFTTPTNVDPFASGDQIGFYPNATATTYYFDGHTSITDPNSNWSNDANAFDGSTATSATPTASGTTSSGYLYGVGTTAPTSGGTIVQVRVRLYGTSGLSGARARAEIYTTSLAEQLSSTGTIASVNTNSATGYGSFVKLAAPAAGWTWATVNALETKIYPNSSAVAAHRLEFEVLTASALTNSTTYYWRARGKDPSGTNTYGAWATTRSFQVDTTAPSVSTDISTGFSGTVTRTWLHTVYGPNPLLVLTADLWQDVAGTGTVTAASFNGVALTQIGTGITNGAMRSEMWYLKAPAAGTYVMSVTVTNATDARKFSAASFSGYDQTSPLDASNTATASTGNPSASVTTLTANALVVSTLSRFSTTAATTNRTSIFNDSVTSVLGAASYQLATTTGSYSDTYTGTAAQDWTMTVASFKPVSTGSVITKTQTATARIQLAITKTQSAIARISISLTKTQTATSRIRKALTLTQPAIARITAAVTKAQTSIARITNSATKTQTAIARVSKAFTLTQLAVARVAKALTLTQPAAARIAKGLTLTQGASARVAKALTKTQTTIARINNTAVTKTQSAIARINNTAVVKTQTATARISKALTFTQPAVARIQLLFTKTQTAVARISVLFTKTQSAIGRITNTAVTKNQSATARLTKALTFTQSATARVAKALTLTQGAIARISKAFTKTQSATARIAVAFTKTQSAIARINNTAVTKLQTAVARITTSLNKTQSAIARIQILGTKTQGALARITEVLTKTQSAIANIVASGVFTKTQSAIARINNVATKVQSATARIQKALTLTQGSLARIAKGFTKTQTAIARIAKALTSTQTAVARIQRAFTLTQSAIARISKAFTFTQTAIARIAKLLAFNQVATARISKQLTKTQSAIANIVVAGVSTKSQTAIARITNGVTKTQVAIARITKSLTLTQSSAARIAKLLTKTQTSVSRITEGITKTIVATARITRALTFTQALVARIQRLLTLTQLARARIQRGFTTTQSATANIVRVTTTNPGAGLSLSSAYAGINLSSGNRQSIPQAPTTDQVALTSTKGNTVSLSTNDETVIL